MTKRKHSTNVIPKKEGILGWLSYLGCQFIVFSLIGILKISGSHAHGSDGLGFLFLMGLVLTIPLMLKSKYPISLSTKTILFLFFAVATIIFELSIYAPEDPSNFLAHCGCEFTEIYKNILWFIGWFCFFSFLWYLHYFYKKAKDGYQWVLLKIILFTLISLLLLIYHQRSINEYGSTFEGSPSIKTYKDVENHYLTNEFLQQMKKMQITNNK